MKVLSAFLVSILSLVGPTAFAGETISEIDPTAAAHFAALVAEADSVTIENWHRYKDLRPETTFCEPEWNQKVAELLREATYKPRLPCACLSWPIIRFAKNGDVILTLTLHHEEKLRATSAGKTGDFNVGSEVCTKLYSLIKGRCPPPPDFKPQKSALPATPKVEIDPPAVGPLKP